jgi:cystathionine gamma-lyase
MNKLKPETQYVREGDATSFEKLYSHDVVTPIHLSSTYYWDQIDKPGPFEYIRASNPTRTALENQLALLENGKYCLAFPSGQAAETTLLLSLLKTGDHILCFDDLYGGTVRLIDSILCNFNITADYINLNETSLLEKSIKPNTKIIWLETPTNPLMKLVDIKKICDIAHKSDILVVVDNTFLTPYFQKPLNLGADIVLHSGTKYFCGHSDTLSGFIMLNNDAAYEKIKFTQTSIGTVLAPFDSYLVLRGLKTLPVRMKAHQSNALQVAQFLEKHPKVKKVYYPGLPSHPQHQLAQAQASGFGGMVSFELDGNINQVKKLFDNLNLFILAESLGGVESLIEHPSTMTHASLSKEQQLNTGITDSLIRISVGIENIEDLTEDLENALSTL